MLSSQMETDETAVSESYRVSQTVNPLFLEGRLEVSKRSAPASVLNCGLNSNISFWQRAIIQTSVLGQLYDRPLPNIEARQETNPKLGTRGETYWKPHISNILDQDISKPHMRNILKTTYWKHIPNWKHTSSPITHVGRPRGLPRKEGVTPT